MNYLLNGATLIETLMKVEFLTSIFLGAIGFAIICLAKRITKTIRKTNFITPNDRIYVLIKVIGLIFIVIAFVVLLLASVNA